MNFFGSNPLGGLFGQNDPRISDEQNQQAQRFAMVQAGLATLADGRPNGLQALAGGLMRGQQAGMGARQNAYAQNQQDSAQKAQQEIASLIQSGQGTPEVLRQIYMLSIARGDSATANAITGFLNATGQDEGGLIQVKDGADTILVRARSGEEVKRFKGAPKEDELVEVDLGDRKVWHVKGRPERIVHMERKGRLPGEGGDGINKNEPKAVRDEATGKVFMGVWNPRTQAYEPVKGVLPVSDKPDNRVAQVSPAMESLDNYETLSRDFFKMSRGQRLAALAGQGNQGLVGRIESAQRAVLLDVKNLAELGVLNGPDMEIITDLIGNPLTKQAVYRDPEYTLARVGEARAFLRRKAKAIGMNPQGAAGGSPFSDLIPGGR